jgi:hypothetical protein
VTHGSPAFGLRIGLFLAAIALLPGIIALVAAGVGGAPTSGLEIAEATGAFSVVALQGLDRRSADTQVGTALLAALAPAPSIEALRAIEARQDPADDSARLTDADAHHLPLRL